MKWNSAHWRQKMSELQKFIDPLVSGIGRSERRESAALYVQGLLMPGQRKSVEPIAARLRVDSQKLQQFLSDSPWRERQVWQAIRREVIPVVEPLQAWVVDETGWLKQGTHSVGVSHQYCGAVGKQAQCQVAVELVVSDGEIAAPVGGRLYLPEGWTKEASRRKGAGVPDGVAFQTKPAIAGNLIEEALGDGLTAAPVLGDSVYGNAPVATAAARLGDGVFFPGRGTLAGVGATAPTDPRVQTLEGCQDGTRRLPFAPMGRKFPPGRVARGGLGSRRRPPADHPLGLEADLSAQ